MAPSRPPSRHFRALMGVPPPAKSGPASSPSFPRQSRSSSPARYVLHQAPAAALRPRRALNLALCSARCCLRATAPPPAPQRVMYQSERCRRHRRPAVCAAAATQTRRESRRALSPKRRGCCPLHSEGRLCTLRLSHTSNVAALYSHAPHPNRNRDCDHARLRELPVRCRAR